MWNEVIGDALNLLYLSSFHRLQHYLWVHSEIENFAIKNILGFVRFRSGLPLYMYPIKLANKALLYIYLRPDGVKVQQ